MDFNEIIPRLMTDERIEPFEKLAFLALCLAGGREGHVQNKTLKEIREYINPPISPGAISDAITKKLIETEWITGTKPSAKESWDIHINTPEKRRTTVKTFEHRIPRAKIVVTIESIEED